MKDALIYIIPLLILLMYLGFILRTKGKEAAVSELRELAYALMMKAQKQFGDGQGNIKMEWVVVRLMPLLPRYATIFLDEDDLRLFLQSLYDSTIDLLDDGKFNDSNK